MRVYEIAKQNDLSSKEVLALLKDAGFELASHMSVVPDEGISYLDAAFKKNKKELKPQAQPEKKEKPLRAVVEKKVKSDDEPEKHSPKTKPAPRAAGKVQVKSAAKPVPSQRPIVRPPHRPHIPEKVVITEIEITEPLPLFEVAKRLGKSCGEIILFLLKKGAVCNRNNVLSIDTIAELATHFNIEPIIQTKAEVSEESDVLKKSTKGDVRWPIVVVMGHVDHGKTTLLDHIRKMNVAGKEKGGITQHIGAYEASSKHGKIVFLDTPGHEAFSYLRSRGARVTDIAILIVAADDGVMPQTIEAIEHAKNSKVPIIVAINKIDKASDSAVQTVKRQLAEKGLVVEDWGGDIICVPISAKTGEGVDELLEMIVLQAEMLDLRANKKSDARAFVLESKLEKGFGPVATVICLDGTIKVGDCFVCGSGTGKVRLLVNSFGEKVKQSGPSIPVKIVGFDNFAEIGDWLRVVSPQEYNKVRSGKISKPSAMSLTQAPQSLGLVDKEKLNLIIKTDTRGSKEAIEGSIEKLVKKIKNKNIDVSIIQSDIGGVSEGDIEFAYTTGAIILGLHAKVERNAENLAKLRGVEIKTFDIIYHLVEYLEEILSKKKLEKVWKKVGLLEVLKVFNIKKVGVIAGCAVREGTISRDNKVACIRNGKKIAEGKISSLQREGKTVKEVHSGYECAFICDNFNDWQVGDSVEALAQVEQESE